MCISGVFALTNISEDGSVFSTAAVSLSLENYTLNSENMEVLYSDENRVVMPGDEISFIPKITNTGADCYVRAKTNIISDTSIDLGDYVKGVSEKWEKRGEYYYYKESLSLGSSVNFFESIKIPETLANEYQNASFKLEVVAEAVQAKNFTLDFTKSDPWGGLSAQANVNVNYDSSGKAAKITVKYEDTSQTDIKVPEDFFSGLSKISPGDTLKSAIKIKNTSSKSAKYFVSIINSKLNDLEKEFLSRVTAVIRSSSGNVLYEGSMLELSKVSLGTYASGSEDTIEIELKIPSSLDNKYLALSPELIWSYSAEYESPEKQGNNPNTGDFKINMVITAFFISAIGEIIVLYLYGREKKTDYKYK